MKTIGDLTLNDIGRTHIRITHQDATIEGPLRVIDLDIEITEVKTMDGTAVYPRGSIRVNVTLTIGQVTLTGISRSHVCEVLP